MAEVVKSSSRNARRFGNIALQTALVVVIGALAYAAIVNAARNLAAAHISSGFGFWDNTAGFDISQTLISYSSSTSSFGRAFWVGLLNTLLVASLAIVLATVLGFIVGIARLSSNWLVAKLAGCYVELIRNVPLLLQILFWYNAVLKSLPELRDSVTLPGGIYLNNRGLFLPRPDFAPGFRYVLVALLFGVLASVVLRVMGAPAPGANGRARAHLGLCASPDHRAAARRIRPERHAALPQFSECRPLQYHGRR